jgi:hypothetical protein
MAHREGMNIIRTENNPLPHYFLGRPRHAYLERTRRRATALTAPIRPALGAMRSSH